LTSEHLFTYNGGVDKKHKNKIGQFYKRERRLPTYAELLKLTSFKSRNAVYKLINRLEAEGFLTKSAAGRLAPAKIYGEVRVLGTVEAGFPSAAEEDLSTTLSLDDYLIENKEACFLLTVRGDSMIDAGIIEGDLAVVERGATAAPGDIVIAEVDGNWTMKYLRSKAGKVYLEAANPKYPLIKPVGELKIAAVVRAVIRKYRA